MEKKQTSVGWLEEKINSYVFIHSPQLRKNIEQAKSMHKEEVSEAYFDGTNEAQMDDLGFLWPGRNADKYYEETYGINNAVEIKNVEIFEEVVTPIGDFVLKNATPIQGAGGYYYHYSDVCKLLNLQAEILYKKHNHLNPYSNEKTQIIP